MTRRAYLYFVLTFVLGIAVGAAATFFYGWYSGRWHPGFGKQRVIRRLTRELSLSDKQVEQLKQIMEESDKDFGNLRRQMGPQFEAIRDRTRERVRQILTAEQAVKFNELVRRWDERRKRQRSP